MNSFFTKTSQRCLITTLCVLQALSCATMLAVPDALHMRWNWEQVDNGRLIPQIIQTLRTKSKKEGFVIGAATAEYQILGAQELPDSSLAHAEKDMQHWQNAHKSNSFYASGAACKGWEKRFEDIALLEKIGMNAYRFSVDWSKIEPSEGIINIKALDHYKELCQELQRRGIKVMVTLHHFVNPQWFAELGGFEKEENSKYFVKFCSTVYLYLGPYVNWWCTINEPGVYVLQGYIRGVMPPFKSVLFTKEPWAPADRCSHAHIGLAARVLKNILRAHVQVHTMLHESAISYGYRTPQVGLAHQYLYFEPYHGTWDPRRMIESSVSNIMTSWTNMSILAALKTGHFTFWGASSENCYIPGLATSLDYIGLNYYSHVFFDLMQGKDQPGRYTESIMTDMPYEIYAEGLYRAIQDISQLGVPIYITENGIADACDGALGDATQNRRDIWIKRYFFAMAQAIEQGYNVRGYFYWSLMDNWEWDMGYGPRFGLYRVDFNDPERPRTLRPNAMVLRDIAMAVTQQNK